MNYRVGDRVLVKAVVAEVFDDRSMMLRIRGNADDLTGALEEEVQSVPPHEVWRWSEDENTTWVVKSDGTVWEAVGGTLKEAKPDYWTEILCEYVRQTAE